MDKSSNQVNGNVNPNQQQSSSSNSNRNQNHNHNQNYQSHPHPPNYSYNQQNSANSAWNLHPSFGAAFNHPSTSAPGHQSYNSYAGSYRPPSSNLSWNRGQEARGAVGGSIDKGKGKAPANQPAHSTNQVRPRPRPLPKKIPTRTEDMQPNELKTDFVYRNFIASNRPPIVKDSKKITNPNPVRPSQSPSTSSASTSSSNSFRPPTGPRPKHNLPNRPTTNINNHNSSNYRSSQKQSSSSSFLNGSGNSAADPQYIDVDEISTNGNGKQPKQKQQKKGKGKGKGKAKEPPQQVRISENGTGEVLSKKAAKRRRKEMREMAKEASTSTIPTSNTATTTSSTNPNLTTLQNNRWGAVQSNPSSSNLQSSVNDSTSSEVNKIEVDLSQSLQVRQTSRSPPAASMKISLETSTPAIAPEDDSEESEADSVRVVETTTTQPINKIDSLGSREAENSSKVDSEESELESPICSVRNLKRKASTPPPSSTSQSSPPPYPANGAVLSRDELEKEVKRIKPSQDQTSFVSPVKTSAAEIPASIGPREAELSKSSQPDIGIGMVMRNQDEVMESRSDADHSVQKQDPTERPSQSTQPIQTNGGESSTSFSSTASSALPSSSSVQVSNPTTKPLVVASNRSTKVPIVKPVRPGPRKQTTSPSNSTKQNGVSSLSDQSAQVQVKSEPSASTSTSTSQAHTLDSAARPPSPSRSTFNVKTEPIDVDEIESAEVIILDSDSDDDLPLADLRSRSKGAMSTNPRNGLELLPSMDAFNYDASGSSSSSGNVKEGAVTSQEPSKKSKPKMKISGLGESRLSAQLDPSHHPRFLLPISSKGYGSQDKSGKDFDSFLVLSRFGHASSSRSDARFFGEPTPIFPSRSFSNRIEEVQRVSSLCVAVASSCQQAVHGDQPPQLTLLFARDPPARDADAELDGSKRKWFATDELEVSPIRHLDSKPHTFGASCLSFFPGQQDESDGGASGDLDLATGGSDGVVFRWTFNSKSRTNGKALPQDRTSRIHALHVSTNSAKATGVKALTDLKRCNSLVSAGTDGKILIYDVDKQMEKGRWKTDDNLVSLRKCPSPHLFMSAQNRSNYDQFKCFDIRQGSKVSKPALSFGWQALKTPSNLSRGSFNPIHKSLYSHPSSEGTVRLWDLRMPKEDPLEIVVSLEKEIYDVGWSKDGRDIVSLCSDGIRKTEVMMGPR